MDKKGLFAQECDPNLRRVKGADKKTSFLLWLTRRLLLLVHHQAGRMPAPLYSQCVAIQRKILKIFAVRKSSGLLEWTQFVESLGRAHSKLFTPEQPDFVVITFEILCVVIKSLGKEHFTIQ